MEKFKVIALGTECQDIATGLQGTVTHWMMDMGRGIDYLFQPKGLNKFGQPLSRIYVCRERLEVQEDKDFEEVEVPFDILGSVVTDKASGFTGMAVNFMRHINGCFHVYIQPKGTLSEENTPIKMSDFDLRACAGEKIPVLSEDEKKKSEKKTPSPTGKIPQRPGI